MGTLEGHLVPGVMMIGLGFWWSIITAIRFILSNKKSPFKKNSTNGYRGSVTMPCLFLPCAGLRRAPIESLVKLILMSIGIIGEAYTGYKTHWHPKSFYEPHTSTGSSVDHMAHHHHNHEHKRSVVNDLTTTTEPEELIKTWSFEYDNAQHITVYFVFLMGSIVEILMHYRFNLPARFEHLFGCIAFGIEAFVFSNHLHGRTAMDIKLHTFFVYSIYGCFISSLFETAWPKQIIFTYGRILFTILQGTWFWQVGFILYPPSKSMSLNWDQNSHHQLMLITISYCWHIMFILTFLLCQMFFVDRLYRTSAKLSNQWDELISIDLIIADNQGTYLKSSGEETKFFSMISQDDDEDGDSVIFDGTKLISNC